MCSQYPAQSPSLFTGWQEQNEWKVLLCSAGDTHPTRTLNELAEGTDLLIQQIMGPLPAFDTLSFESQYLLNVSQRPLQPYTASWCHSLSPAGSQAECCADICCSTVMLTLNAP